MAAFSCDGKLHLRGANHMMMVERPDELLAALQT
jgi:hypothetical protein